MEDVRLASHDDTDESHVDEAAKHGIQISEFPTTRIAAEAARKAGMSIVVGAPNLVRSESHSGNVSACELANLDLLDSSRPIMFLRARFRQRSYFTSETHGLCQKH
jgi:alpha-D-ribose 1-methylphosphonate 5-triphosphate diphosphatase PhnM